MATATSKTKPPAKAPAKSASSKTAAKPAKVVKTATAPKTATAKPAAPKTAAAKPAAKPKAPAKPAAKSAAKRPAVSSDQRRYYIEVAAYYIAERRGFHGGSQLSDWAQAEKEIEQLLAAGRINL